MKRILRKAKRIAHRVHVKQRHMKLGTKTTLMNMITVFVPLIVSLFLFNAFTTKSVYESIQTQAMNSYTQLFSVISNKIETIRQSALLIQIDANARSLLQGSLWDADRQTLVRVKSYVNHTINYVEDINVWDARVHMYIDTPNDILFDNLRFYPASDVTGTDWYDSMVTQPYKNSWYSAVRPDIQVDDLFYLVRVCDPQKIDETTAISQFVLSRESLKDDMRQFLPAYRGTCLVLMNENGIIAQVGNGDEAGVNPQYNTAVGFDYMTNGVYEENGKRYNVQARSFKGNAWQLAMYMPTESSLITLLNNSQWIFFLALAIVCGVIVCIISVHYSNRIVQRITLVSNGMNDMRNEGLLTLPEPEIKDEMGVLIDSYNRLSNELRRMNEERARAVVNQHKAELRILQAQINPHFLYNTLEMINYFSMVNDPGSVEKIVLLLSRFYKLCLNHGAEFCTFKEEVDLTLIYWTIQSIRYKGKLNLVKNIPSELDAYIVPHIILQPIVENAIHYGIMSRDDTNGTVVISAKKENGVLSIEITDNGVGMSKEKLLQVTEGMLYTGQSQIEDSHYGLHNINERIRGHYGESFGLSFVSSPGAGTTVVIRIPARLS